MKPTLMRSLVVVAALTSATVMAQTDPPASSAALPSAPSAAGSAPAPVATGAGVKIGTINIEAAIFACNEGQRDGNEVATKLQPKQTELKNLNDEIDSLKKQLNTQGASLNEDAKADLTKRIEQKQKQLERNNNDLQEEARNQENEIGQRILKKMGPLIVKYASDNGFGLIIDTSANNQWPNGPVLWQSPTIDITKVIVDQYNVQSGVPAPAQPKSSTPSGSSKPAGTGLGGSKPASTPSTTKPPTTQPKQ